MFAFDDDRRIKELEWKCSDLCLQIQKMYFSTWKANEMGETHCKQEAV